MPAWKDVEEEQERRAEAAGSPEPHRAAARAAAQVWTACASGPRNSSGGGGRMDAARDRQGLRADGAVAAAGSGEPAGGLVGSSGDRRTTRRAAFARSTKWMHLGPRGGLSDAQRMLRWLRLHPDGLQDVLQRAQVAVVYTPRRKLSRQQHKTIEKRRIASLARAEHRALCFSVREDMRMR